MKPKKPDTHADLFRARLSQMLDPKEPLLILGEKIDWEEMEEELGGLHAPGPGQPPLPTRLMAGLHFLKYAHDMSDERVVEIWRQNPYWQAFCGYEHMQMKAPLNSSSMTRWRERVGERLDCLLTQTIRVARREGFMGARELERVNVDTTVQEKAVAFPTDARLYHKARAALVREARKRDVALRQSYKRVGKKALILCGRYGYARQMKRAARQTRALKTMLGRVVRDIRRKVPSPDAALETLLERSERLLKQKREDKGKLYSVHAPEVECIAKGKPHRRYEFGCKVSFATTSKGNWLVSAMSLAGNPYDGHTLAAALEQIERLAGQRPKRVYCDQGYRGHGVSGETRVHVVGKIPKTATRTARKWMKRRAAIEPTIGHLKSDHRLHRNRLKGRSGDRANAVLAAAGYNFAKLLAGFSRAWRKFREFLLRGRILSFSRRFSLRPA